LEVRLDVVVEVLRQGRKRDSRVERHLVVGQRVAVLVDLPFEVEQVHAVDPASLVALVAVVRLVGNCLDALADDSSQVAVLALAVLLDTKMIENSVNYPKQGRIYLPLVDVVRQDLAVSQVEAVHLDAYHSTADLDTEVVLVALVRRLDALEDPV
jgi:hypothetical protein